MLLVQDQKQEYNQHRVEEWSKEEISELQSELGVQYKQRDYSVLDDYNEYYN